MWVKYAKYETTRFSSDKYRFLLHEVAAADVLYESQS